MPNTLSPLQYLTNPTAKWVKVLMCGCLLWTVTHAVMSLKDDVRRSSRVRVRRGRNEHVIDPELTPGEKIDQFNKSLDSLKQSPSFKAKMSRRSLQHRKTLTAMRKYNLTYDY